MKLKKPRATSAEQRDWKRFIGIASFAIGVPICVVAIALCLYSSKFGRFLSGSHEQWGQFGDFIAGTINPVVGLVTILLLILTLHSQRQELREQRRAVATQTFEQTFYTYVSSIVSAIERCTVTVKREGVDHKLVGSAAFTHVVRWDASPSSVRRLSNLVHNIENSDGEARRKNVDRLARYVRTYTLVRTGDEASNFAIPVRIFIDTLKFLHRTKTARRKDKMRYFTFLRANLPASFIQYLFIVQTSTGRVSKTLVAMSKIYSVFYFLDLKERDLLLLTAVHYCAHQFPESSFSKTLLETIASHMDEKNPFGIPRPVGVPAPPSGNQ